MPIQSLAVFCGSKNGSDPIYSAHAAELGKLLAKYNIKLIYGGGGKGIMKIIADHAMENGGTVIGVIPKILIEWEHQHKNISQLIITDDMHSRKKTMYSMCDAALVLPGGLGTLDEMFEMLTWNQLSIHDKKIFIMNSGGFFDHLIRHIASLEENGFLYEPAEKRIKFLNDPSEFEAYVESEDQSPKL
ncbi:MAG TPA: TIGR00730 family Rossman fold protein [Chitinophagaceae bacterium]|jgi:uncharacterized protein (TIGR00730 family)|nr:TIGR00730 family Rossman fold protein [Chitinophagaceae bacterium]